MRVEIENPMVKEPTHPIRYVAPVTYTECDCGCKAKLKINGAPRCWECAEDEGVERI